MLVNIKYATVTHCDLNVPSVFKHSFIFCFCKNFKFHMQITLATDDNISCNLVELSNDIRGNWYANSFCASFVVTLRNSITLVIRVSVVRCTRRKAGKKFRNATRRSGVQKRICPALDSFPGTSKVRLQRAQRHVALNGLRARFLCVEKFKKKWFP